MTLPLPQQMLLLSAETARHRLDVASVLVRGPLLRAAAAADLALHGALRPSGRRGRVERTGAGDAGGDPFLAAVLDAVPTDRERRWFGVVDEDFHLAEDAVLDGLEADGTITTERRRAWGLFPVRRTTVTRPAQVTELRERVRDAVLGGHDPAEVAIADAVLAVLAADGGVGVAFGIREQHRHRAAFKDVADRVEARLPGFREGTLYAIAARRAAAS
ncbi:GPP34 family phosphoprotein [Actinomycetospora lutea]|uniref:GPP34 family phosphoprotein n=1 Tax=Actinomycetospora lutea TaxID=663604 RepID=UPI002366EA0B|nr:GPP34 family phosphoprotein [Actinomycetospora lutea]MDD7939213.1 GPP34 family phosphoprotein [Actinomycetospora lutea]